VTFRYKNEVISAVAVVVVIAILFSSLFLYTGNWPPAVIVESSSMQHGNNFVFGVINTGDIVGVKKIDSFANVQTYLVARERGNPITYGEYGNVVIYKNSLLRELVIHRAIFYVEGWNGTTPILYGNTHPSWLSIQGPNVYITDVGYSHRNLLVQLENYIGQVGFVTMGDHNFADSPYHIGNYTLAADQNENIDNSLVSSNQVVGVAVGYIPIVGVMKLWVTGQTTFIPENSNIAMIIIIVVIVALAIVPLPSPKSRRKERN
jgi:signal peptidase